MWFKMFTDWLRFLLHDDIWAYFFTFVPDEFMTPIASNCRISSYMLDQGECGACIAFAHATAIAMRLCLNMNIDFIPSPYRLFDCARGKCNKGLSFPELKKWLSNGVSDLNQSKQIYNQSCSAMHGPRFFMSNVMTGLRTIQIDIMQNGPVTGAIVVNNNFQVWGGGIYHINRSKALSIHKHAVVLVGWGAFPEPHWIIRNSWGTDWGEHGMGRLEFQTLDYAISYTNSWNPSSEFLWLFARVTGMGFSFLVKHLSLLFITMVCMILIVCYEQGPTDSHLKPKIKDCESGESACD